MGIFRQTHQSLGIVSVDYSENHADKKSDGCHTKRDKVVSRDQGQQPTYQDSDHDPGDNELQDILRHASLSGSAKLLSMSVTGMFQQYGPMFLTIAGDSGSL